MTWARAWGAAMLVALAAAAPARADDKPPIVSMDFVERDGGVEVDTSVSRLFDRDSFASLDSGFRTTVVIRLWVYEVDGRQPVAYTVLRRSAIYQLWDEVYDVRLEGAGPRRDVRVRTRGEALRLLTSLDDVRIAATAQLPPGKLFILAVVAELNPISAETLAEVRRWLSQGTGGGLERGGALFGSFVSVFVNLKVPAADRVYRSRSQRFYRP